MCKCASSPTAKHDPMLRASVRTILRHSLLLWRPAAVCEVGREVRRSACPSPTVVLRCREEAIRTGFLLSQGGEFAFVLLSLAKELKVLPDELNRLLIIVVVLSMALTPFLTELGKTVADASAAKNPQGHGHGASASHLERCSSLISTLSADQQAILSFECRSVCHAEWCLCRRHDVRCNICDAADD